MSQVDKADTKQAYERTFADATALVDASLKSCVLLERAVDNASMDP